jgi:hypothetical protein
MLYKEKMLTSPSMEEDSGKRTRSEASVVVDAGGRRVHDTEFSHDVVDGLCDALLNTEEMTKVYGNIFLATLSVSNKVGYLKQLHKLT